MNVINGQIGYTTDPLENGHYEANTEVYPVCNQGYMKTENMECKPNGEWNPPDVGPGCVLGGLFLL